MLRRVSPSRSAHAPWMTGIAAVWMRWVRVMRNLVRGRVSAQKNGRSVCIIAEANAFGGAEVHTLALIETLVNRECRVELVACRNHQYDERIRWLGLQQNVRLIHTELSIGVRILNGSRGWFTILRKLEGDVLVFPKTCHQVGSLALHVLFRLLFRRIVIIEHLEAEPLLVERTRHWSALFTPGYSWLYRHRVSRWLTALCADRIVAVSAAVQQRLLVDWGYPPRLVVVARNGVDAKKFPFSPVPNAEVRQALAIPANAFVFVMVARLRPEKGIDIAIRALRACIDRTGLEIRLVILGEGAGRNDLTRLTATLGLARQVHFLGFQSDPRPTLSAADSVLFSSRIEGLPLGLLEAMACGCVPIVANISGMPEAVRSREIGWVVEPENVNGFAEAMEEFISLSADSRKAYRCRAREAIVREFSIEDSHEQILRACGLKQI